jgi:hypothetical protein
MKTKAAPNGIRSGKQFKLDGQPFQVYGQAGYNVVRPDGATSWRAIGALALVF